METLPQGRKWLNHARTQKTENDVILENSLSCQIIRFQATVAAFKGEIPVQLFGDLTVKLISVMSRVKGSVPVGEMMERLTIDGLGLAAMGKVTQEAEGFANTR